MRAKRIVVYLVFLTVVFQTFVLPASIVEADSTTWDTYELNNQWADCMFTVGAGLLHGSNLIKTKDYSIKMSAFWYFNAVNITSWGQVKTAYLSVYRVATGYNATSYNARLYAIDLADDMGFYYPSGPITDPEARPLTSAYTLVNDAETDDWAEGWLNITVTNQVIEVVRDQYGWAANNSLSFKMTNSVGADRYVRAYEYGNNTYGAKLYVERITGRVYDGGWDNGELTNSTDWGDLWEVWNGSVITAFEYGYQKLLGRYSLSGYTPEREIVSSGVSYTPTGFLPYHAFVDQWGGYLYTLKIDSSGGLRHLYRADLDDLASWSEIGNISGGDYTTFAITDAGEVYVVQYVVGSLRTYLYYYNATDGATITGHGTGSLDAGEKLIAWTLNKADGHIYILTYYATSNRLRLYEKTHSATSWTIHQIFTGDATYANIWSGQGWIDTVNGGADFMVFIYSNSGSNQAWLSTYVDHDYSYTAKAQITPTNHYAKNSQSIQYCVDGLGGVGVTFVHQSYLGYTSDIVFKRWTGEKAGSWSGDYYLNDQVGYMVSIDYGTTLDPDGFLISNHNDTHVSAKFETWTVSTGGSFTPSTTYDNGNNYSASSMMIQSVGSEGTHYYQFHYYNCTWINVTPTPVIPPNPWVPVADPDPDTYPDPTNGYLGRLNMRLYLIVIGLGLFVVPPILWSKGRTEMLEIAAGLVSMMFGVALLMAAGHV